MSRGWVILMRFIQNFFFSYLNCVNSVRYWLMKLYIFYAWRCTFHVLLKSNDDNSVCILLGYDGCITSLPHIDPHWRYNSTNLFLTEHWTWRRINLKKSVLKYIPSLMELISGNLLAVKFIESHTEIIGINKHRNDWLNQLSLVSILKSLDVMRFDDDGVNYIMWA